jgi:Fe-S-cluster containining protein
MNKNKAKTKSRTAGLQDRKHTGTIDDKCSRCLPAKCCLYFSLEIDRPRSKRDYDDLLWFLAHDDVSIYIWKKDWYLMVHNRCKFLDVKTNLCSAYEYRPRMCREHTTDDCEFDSDYDFDEHFKSYEDLKRWMKKKKAQK